MAILEGDYLPGSPDKNVPDSDLNKPRDDTSTAPEDRSRHEDYGVRHLGEYETPGSSSGGYDSGGGGGGGGSGGSGSGGGGSGGTSGGSYDGPGKDYNDADDAARFLGVGGHPEVWKDSETGQTFLVYFVDTVEPPIPLMFEVPEDGKTLQSFFGEGNKIVIDNNVNTAEITSTGAVKFGTTNNLHASEGDPWLGFKDRMDRVTKIQPWLLEPDVLAIVAGAFLENRDVREWELQTTDWYREHNAEERGWMELSFGDPAAAQKKIADDQLYVSALFDGIGADGTDAALIDWMGSKFTTGAWSEVYVTQQVEAVTSGWYDLDSELDTFVKEGDIELATTKSQHEKVRGLWNTWLGPAYEPTQDDLSTWATKIRNTDDGEEELVNMLRGQRSALYPTYEDENLTYQDIAGPWRNMAANMWGQTPDEKSDMFQNIIRDNDYAAAGKTLRREGMAQNIDKVWDDATAASSGNLRRAL